MAQRFFFRFVFVFNYLLNYFLFLEVLRLGIHHFWWKKYFPRIPGSCRYNFGTCWNKISTTNWFATIPSSSPVKKTHKNRVAPGKKNWNKKSSWARFSSMDFFLNRVVHARKLHELEVAKSESRLIRSQVECITSQLESITSGSDPVHWEGIYTCMYTCIYVCIRICICYRYRFFAFSSPSPPPLSILEGCLDQLDFVEVGRRLALCLNDTSNQSILG